MPLLGWLLSLAFASVIRSVDHWIAFVLLVIIGGRMVRAGLSADPNVPTKKVSSASGWALPPWRSPQVSTRPRPV
ncbi:MAG: manganese efflux pump [Casimicrobiaceae bacterium]